METLTDRVKARFLGDVQMAADETPKSAPETKRERFEQVDFPKDSISEGVIIAKIISDQYGGSPTAPHQIAFAMQISPSSNKWRFLVGTSSAYGLTKGSYTSKQIELSPLGRKYAEPTEQHDDKRALREAIMIPKIMGEFYKKYNQKNFPDTNIAENVLVSMGLPKDRASKAVEILIENGVTAGILRKTPSGGYFVALDEPLAPPKAKKPKNDPSFSADQGSEDDQTPPAKPERVTFGKGLYVNFEIHIAADTPIETITAIFQNMKKYLIDNE